MNGNCFFAFRHFDLGNVSQERPAFRQLEQSPGSCHMLGTFYLISSHPHTIPMGRDNGDSIFQKRKLRLTVTLPPLPQVSQLVGRRNPESHPGLCASKHGGPILPLVPTCGPCQVARPSQGQRAAYLTAEPVESASSPAPPGASAGPFLPRPGAPVGVPGAGSGGCGWIPSSSAPLWPVDESGIKRARSGDLSPLPSSSYAPGCTENSPLLSGGFIGLLRMTRDVGDGLATAAILYHVNLTPNRS